MNVQNKMADRVDCLIITISDLLSKEHELTEVGACTIKALADLITARALLNDDYC